MDFILSKFHFYITVSVIVAVLTFTGHVEPLVLYGILIDRIIIYSVKRLGI
ncbi:hypothetical protein OD350_22345 [Clostridium beijerinckii]|uniref:hypothetical protein n=1 Tax=Clostridium beijerinckii TaxID=1520 RepID=UPI00222763BA|nr:hypothetical protein [Clostridium beijerinckii]UYZ34962.1 hypothetical protein OD350_22345 [Clostridium beijerinckii]